MNLTAEEIRILISWYVCHEAIGPKTVPDYNLLEKLRAELRRIEDDEEDSQIHL